MTPGLAGVMREKAVPGPRARTGPVLDIVGTGATGHNTFQYFDYSRFLWRPRGSEKQTWQPRCNQPNAASADVLEKLGVKIDLTAEEVQQCIREAGIGVMFAPMFHPAMKFAAGPRSEIGIRSVFNILGPLTNPAYAEYQVIGVPSIDLAEKIVPALMRLSVKHALVVHGLNGMDEISITGRSMCWEIRRGELQRYRQQIAPEDFGLQRASENAVRGGTPEENAQTVLKVLRGSRGPIRDVVLLNAAARCWLE